MARSKECDALTDKMLKDAVRQKQDALSKKKLNTDVNRANKLISNSNDIEIKDVSEIEYGPRVSLCCLITANNHKLYCCKYKSNGKLTTKYTDIDSAKRDYYELNRNIE